ncbi:MAG: hypothetical protein LBQ79_11740 [Deltaproteobacteria bacterium]|jgi:hypothetical protein|nr:hypothetical protein [Deltaproteobacteria bacterium]
MKLPGSRTISPTARGAAAALLLMLLASAVLPGTASAAPMGDGDVVEAAFSTLEDHTSLAVSPGLILLARGGYAYVMADRGAELMWHQDPTFLLVLASVLAVFLLKDLIPVEPLQKFLAAIEEGSMVVIGLIAYAAAIPGLANFVGPTAEKAAALIGPYIFSAPAYAQTGAADPATSALAAGIASVCGTLIYAVVWCVSNSINVLLLVAPSFAAPFLKAMRLAVAGGLTALGAAHPVLGLLAALAVVILSAIVVGWSFRLTVWGFRFSFDLVFLRWRRIDPELLRRDGPPMVKAFATGMARKLLRIPKRAYGRLVAREGYLFFEYRRFALFRRSVPVPGPGIVLHRIASPSLAVRDPAGRTLSLFTFRLRHRGHEELLRRAVCASAVEDWGLKAQKDRAAAWLKGLFRRRAEEEVPAW